MGDSIMVNPGLFSYRCSRLLSHAWVQVEGRVVDPSTDTVLVTFSDRRRGSGVIGLRDLGGDAGPAMVREMLESVAEDVKRELQEIFALDE